MKRIYIQVIDKILDRVMGKRMKWILRLGCQNEQHIQGS
jgi:hypothetical protein